MSLLSIVKNEEAKLYERVGISFFQKIRKAQEGREFWRDDAREILRICIEDALSRPMREELLEMIRGYEIDIAKTQDYFCNSHGELRYSRHDTLQKIRSMSREALIEILFEYYEKAFEEDFKYTELRFIVSVDSDNGIEVQKLILSPQEQDIPDINIEFPQYNLYGK